MALINATKWLPIDGSRSSIRELTEWPEASRFDWLVREIGDWTKVETHRVVARTITQRARINRFAKWRTGKRSVKPRDIESSGASRVMMAGAGSCSITKIVWKQIGQGDGLSSRSLSGARARKFWAN